MQSAFYQGLIREQRGPRKKGNSVFVDDQLQPYDDQWVFLSAIKRLTPEEVQTLLRNVYSASDVINVRHVTTDYDVANDPWLLPPSGRVVDTATTEPLPPNISITRGNLIYVEKKDLSDVFLDRLMRLAAFQNPEFYRAQSMRLSIFGKPRVIACAEDLRRHIALPRGLLKEVLDLFDSHRIAVKVTDHRFGGVPVEFDFHGKKQAVASAFQYEVIPRLTEFTVPPEWNGIGIEEIYTALVHDNQRSDLIVADVVAAIETDAFRFCSPNVRTRVPNIFVMKGGMGKKQRDALASEDQSRPRLPATSAPCYWTLHWRRL